MALLRFPFNPRLHPPLSRRPIPATFRPSLAAAHRPIPARDRTIDFGKHKGRMLGTLPSAYLRWVSRTLRAGDTEEWARLADEVLADSFYRDRLEWEFAERLLTGGDLAVTTDSPVADLLEISGRFGWDNEDKKGWEMVDFRLLGTSRGGRIPRIGGKAGEEERFCEVVEVKGKRGERRERQKVRRREEMRRVRKEVVGVDVRRESDNDSKNGEQQQTQFVNPFPGRSALLDKIKGREGDFE